MLPFKKLDMQDHNNSYKQTFNEASTVTIVMKHKLEDDQKRLELTLRWGLCNNNDGDDDDDDAAVALQHLGQLCAHSRCTHRFKTELCFLWGL